MSGDMSGDMLSPKDRIQWKDREEHLRKLSHKDIVKFALFCAKQMQQTLPEAVKAIEVTERWLDGKATREECKSVSTYAAYAATAATVDTTYASTYAAYAAAATANAAIVAAYTAVVASYTAVAASYAATAASYATTTVAQEVIMEYLYELLYIDEIAEKILLRNTYVK